MQLPPITKYRPFPPVALPDRQWPNRVHERAPVWCSVDLRDGNQALAIPMSVPEKLEMFGMLCRIGFKEIEIGFPSASDTEFAFCRKLIEEKLVPEGVSLQVLVQSREHLIRRTIEALAGAKKAVVHLYTPTNPAQRKIVFGMTKEQIKEVAISGTKLIREITAQHPETEWAFEFSPETFVLTEQDFALEVCEAVADEWGANPERKIILNLPLTVEVCTPNVHADQIEWFCRHLRQRDRAIISVHTHNDRGTGTAATELAMLAGADRVEGTLFGNGERTGNLDLVTVALNLYTQGVHPSLDFSNLMEIREVYERNTRMTVHPRHPYAGDLVFTAFSGSHQDAIKKGMDKQDKAPGAVWEVPYLPIDPTDLGRSYEAIIRINSQSGKGGVAFVLERENGYEMPKRMHPEFGEHVGKVADKLGRELTPVEIYELFRKDYLERTSPLRLETYEVVARRADHEEVEITAFVNHDGRMRKITGIGNGPISAFVQGLENGGLKDFNLLDYRQHSLSTGSGAQAACYIEIKRSSDQRHIWGVGVDSNIELAGLKALVCAWNRAR